MNHPDHLGSTSLTTNSSGKLVEETTYYPYGEVFEGGNKRYTYTGKELDSSDLYYYGQRYYSADILMRFTQADSLIPNIYNPQSLNRYSYVLNNPYKYVDENGLWAVLVDVGVGGAVPGAGGAISGGIAISYSEQYGFQATFAGKAGGGLAIGGIGKFSLGVDISSEAQQVSDISGTSMTRGGAVAYGPYAGGYTYSEDESEAISHGFYWTPGFGAEYREYEVKTGVLPWKIQIGGDKESKNINPNEINKNQLPNTIAYPYEQTYNLVNSNTGYRFSGRFTENELKRLGSGGTIKKDKSSFGIIEVGKEKSFVEVISR